MNGLPMLPGNNFGNNKTNFHRSQTLGFRNGYTVQKLSSADIGLPQNQLEELISLDSYNPQLFYGQSKPPAPEPFVPSFVFLDKKVLKFKGWFKETIRESQSESHRIRFVNIFYHLEDDTMAVVEPVVENSGLAQGKLLRRQRVPKNEAGECYTWKDFNIGKNLFCFGRIFHIYDCDEWTAEYLRSEGIEVQAPEECPQDPQILLRDSNSKTKTATTNSPNSMDKLRKFLELDGKVLRFNCLWNDRKEGERREFVLHYYLADDTMEIREVHKKNNGRDPFPLLVSRRRIPKTTSIDPDFPSIVLEVSDKELGDCYSPKDFAIGRTVLIYNRPLLIRTCDEFTKAFYWQNFGITDFEPVEETNLREMAVDREKEIPEYRGFGKMEDSLRSYEQLIPEPKKKDVIKMMEYDKLVLRYEAVMDTINPDNKSRRFIISYRLADDMVSIYEPKTKNSGLIGGKYLEKTKIAKPGSKPDRPEYYGPGDFRIGGVIDAFKTRFVVVGADEFTVNYIEKMPGFDKSIVEEFRKRNININNY